MQFCQCHRHPLSYRTIFHPTIFSCNEQFFLTSNLRDNLRWITLTLRSIYANIRFTDVTKISLRSSNRSINKLHHIACLRLPCYRCVLIFRPAYVCHKCLVTRRYIFKLFSYLIVITKVASRYSFVQCARYVCKDVVV